MEVVVILLFSYEHVHGHLWNTTTRYTYLPKVVITINFCHFHIFFSALFANMENGYNIIKDYFDFFRLVGMIKEMRSKGVNFNVRLPPYNMTVLHLAVKAQDKKILTYLIKNSIARINDVDDMVSEPVLDLIFMETAPFRICFLTSVLFLENSYFLLTPELTNPPGLPN